MEGSADNLRHEWRFRIGDAFPADSPLARFLVAVGATLNDNILSNTLFVQAKTPSERIYFFNLASSHLYEAAETLLKADREWPEVRDFVATLDEARRDEFERVIALARQAAPWPGERLKVIRNAFFHYLRLDRGAYEAGKLALADGLMTAADMKGLLVIEPGATLSGIRALFAEEVAIKVVSADFDEDEMKRLTAALANYQADLNRFAQAALGRYLSGQPKDMVAYEETEVVEEGDGAGRS